MRGFNGFMSFAFCFTAVNVFSSISSIWGSYLTIGGPVVMSWGWIVCSIFTIITGAQPSPRPASQGPRLAGR